MADALRSRPLGFARSRPISNANCGHDGAWPSESFENTTGRSPANRWKTRWGLALQITRKHARTARTRQARSDR